MSLDRKNCSEESIYTKYTDIKNKYDILKKIANYLNVILVITDSGADADDQTALTYLSVNKTSNLIYIFVHTGTDNTIGNTSLEIWTTIQKDENLPNHNVLNITKEELIYYLNENTLTVANILMIAPTFNIQSNKIFIREGGYLYTQGSIKEESFNCMGSSIPFMLHYEEQLREIPTFLCAQMLPTAKLLCTINCSLRRIIMSTAFCFALGRIPAEHNASKFVAERFVNPKLATKKPSTNWNIVAKMYEMFTKKELALETYPINEDDEILLLVKNYFENVYSNGEMQSLESIKYLYCMCKALQEIMGPTLFEKRERLFYSTDPLLDIKYNPQLVLIYENFCTKLLSEEGQLSVMPLYDLYAAYVMKCCIEGIEPVQDPHEFNNQMIDYFSNKYM